MSSCCRALSMLSSPRGDHPFTIVQLNKVQSPNISSYFCSSSNTMLKLFISWEQSLCRNWSIYPSILLNESRSRASNFALSEPHLTVKVLTSFLFISASSPKWSPEVSFRTILSFVPPCSRAITYQHSTCPSIIMQNISPVSPARTIVSPFLNHCTLNPSSKRIFSYLSKALKR